MTESQIHLCRAARMIGIMGSLIDANRRLRGYTTPDEEQHLVVAKAQLREIAREFPPARFAFEKAYGATR